MRAEERDPGPRTASRRDARDQCLAQQIDHRLDPAIARWRDRYPRRSEQRDPQRVNAGVPSGPPRGIDGSRSNQRRSRDSWRPIRNGRGLARLGFDGRGTVDHWICRRFVICGLTWSLPLLAGFARRRAALVCRRRARPRCRASARPWPGLLQRSMSRCSALRIFFSHAARRAATAERLCPDPARRRQGSRRSMPDPPGQPPAPERHGRRSVRRSRRGFRRFGYMCLCGSLCLGCRHRKPGSHSRLM